MNPEPIAMKAGGDKSSAKTIQNTIYSGRNDMTLTNKMADSVQVCGATRTVGTRPTYTRNSCSDTQSMN